MGRVAFLIATIMEFLQLTEKRFSARRFTDEAVAQADLDYIMECVRMAPSACNRQPWHFVIVESDYAKALLRRCYDREWFATAPLYIVCLKNTEENWVRAEDSHAQMEPVAIIPIGHIADDCPQPEKKRKSIDEITSRV